MFFHTVGWQLIFCCWLLIGSLWFDTEAYAQRHTNPKAKQYADSLRGVRDCYGKKGVKPIKAPLNKEQLECLLCAMDWCGSGVAYHCDCDQVIAIIDCCGNFDFIICEGCFGDCQFSAYSAATSAVLWLACGGAGSLLLQAWNAPALKAILEHCPLVAADFKSLGGTPDPADGKHMVGGQKCPNE